MIPSAPASSARLKRGASFQAIRTSAAAGVPAATWSCPYRVSRSPAPCSMSRTRKSNPAWPAISTETVDPMVQKQPVSTSPAITLS